MPRKFIKRYLPDAHRVRDHQHLKMFGRLLHDPLLWHLNRYSVAGALGTGVFLAFIPMPFQMLAAAAIAILLRFNLPVAVVTVWISNPFTMPPMFFFSYRIGNWLMGAPVRDRGFEPTLEWFWVELGDIWQPLYLGSLVIGVIAGLAAYGLVHLVWRIHVSYLLRLRRSRRNHRLAKQPDSGDQ